MVMICGLLNDVMTYFGDDDDGVTRTTTIHFNLNRIRQRD